MKKMKREIVTELIKQVIRNIDLSRVVDTSNSLFESATSLLSNNDWQSIVVQVQAWSDLIQ